MKRKGISKERLKKIKELDLLTYYTNYEPDELIPNGKSDYKTKTYSSLHLSNGLWTYWAKGIGGRSALDFFIKVKGYEFLEAAHYLNELIEKKPPEKIFQYHKKAHKLILPRRSDNDETVKKYLIDERKIDKDIVQYCIDKGLIYESDKDHSVIFVGYDSHRFPKHASLRSTKDTTKKDIYGSDKTFSFSIRNPSSRKVHVFESAIDLLSYMTLLKNIGRNYLDDNYLSLSGASVIGKSIEETSIPAALERFIKDEFIDTVYLHLDNDRAGKETSEKIVFHLGNKLKVYNQPPSMGKDFNELLQIKKDRKRYSKLENRF